MRVKILYIVFISYVFITGCSSTIERTYYIPQAKMYVKTTFKRGQKFGYIAFSNDSIINLSKEVDYIKSSAQLSAIFLLNAIHNDDIGILYNGNIIEVNSVKYHFVRNISDTDTIYFEKRYKTKPLILKKPYFKFTVMDYFNRALIKESGVQHYTEIQPIK
jgi:hypothetical protein